MKSWKLNWQQRNKMYSEIRKWMENVVNENDLWKKELHKIGEITTCLYEMIEFNAKHKDKEQ